MTPPARRDEFSAPWFDGLLDGVLLIRRCRHCLRYSRPDTAACPGCTADLLDWVPSAGTATVVATITDPITTCEPVTLGLVELDEGPWLHTRLGGSPAPGDRVRMKVDAPAGGEPIPVFDPWATPGHPAD